MSQLTETTAEAETVTVTLKRIRCRHVHADARQCGSPALRNEQFCHFHHTTRHPRPKPGKFRHLDANEPFELPIVEDFPSALSVAAQILCRIASNDLDPVRAGRMLFNLQVITTLLDRAERAAKPKPGAPPLPPADLVEQLIDDETHGPIAPIVEYTPPAPPPPTAELPEEPASIAATEPATPPLLNPETATAPPPFKGAPRFYSACEQEYLSVRLLKGEETTYITRPPSLSQQELDDYIAFRQARKDAEEAAKNPPRKKKGLTLHAVASPRVPHVRRTLHRVDHGVTPLPSNNSVILSEGDADAAAEGPAVVPRPATEPSVFSLFPPCSL